MDFQVRGVGGSCILWNNHLGGDNGEHCLTGITLDDTFGGRLGQTMGVIGNQLRTVNHRPLSCATCAHAVVDGLLQPLITGIQQIKPFGIGGTHGLVLGIREMVLKHQWGIEHVGFYLVSIAVGCRDGLARPGKCRHG